MPYCILSVASDLSLTQIEKLRYEIDSALKNIAKTPLHSVMINIIPKAHISMDGNNDVAMLEVHTVPMSLEMKEKLGQKFLEIISEVTNIQSKKIFIYFTICERENWFLRGRTLQSWKEEWDLKGQSGFTD